MFIKMLNSSLVQKAPDFGPSPPASRFGPAVPTTPEAEIDEESAAIFKSLQALINLHHKNCHDPVVITKLGVPHDPSNATRGGPVRIIVFVLDADCGVGVVLGVVCGVGVAGECVRPGDPSEFVVKLEFDRGVSHCAADVVLGEDSVV